MAMIHIFFTNTHEDLEIEFSKEKVKIVLKLEWEWTDYGNKEF